MLSPEYLQGCSEYAEELAAELHTEIMNAIIARIHARMSPDFVFQGDKYLLTDTDAMRVEILQEAGMLEQEVIDLIAEKTGLMKEEIRRAFVDAGVKSVKYDDEVYREAGLQVPDIRQSPYFLRLVERNYQAVMSTVHNLTGTTALASQQLFIRTTDRMLNLTAMGAEGYTKAYYDAINEIARQGLTITYPSGHTDTIEVATLRALRTGISQMSAQIGLARMDEMDCDLVVVSSHFGARPSHQVWQGKIYSRSGKSRKYPNFEQSTGYGTGAGLCGWNCRHSFSPYFEGMGNPFDRYGVKENKEAYDLSQRQRLLERRIRHTKRQISNEEQAENFEEIEKLRKLLKRQNAAYREFCKENDLKPQAVRLAIARGGN